MPKLNGNHLQVTFAKNSTDSKIALAHATTDAITINDSLVEVVKDRTGAWTDYTSGRKSSTISFSGFTDYDTITDRYNVPDMIEFVLESPLLYFLFGSDEFGHHHQGTGRINDLSFTNGVDDAAGYSGTLTVVGPLILIENVTLNRIQDSDDVDITDSDGNFVMSKTTER